MRVPQVSERVKELPAQALRGVFAGIGQLLLITDKLRNKIPAGQQVPRRPERPETVADTAPPAGQVPEVRDRDKTGNVRLLDGAEAGAGARAAVTAEAAAAEAGTAAAAEADTTMAADAEAAAPTAGKADAPLPNYEELSIASLRARLRNLDAAQVKQLAEYERAHAARPDVIAMFERRMAKLEAGG